MKIISDFHNEMLRRREIFAHLDSSKNPSFTEVEKVLSESLNVPAGNIAVKGIIGKFGRSTFEISVFVYDNESDKKKFEPKPKVKSNNAGGGK